MSAFDEVRAGIRILREALDKLERWVDSQEAPGTTSEPKPERRPGKARKPPSGAARALADAIPEDIPEAGVCSSRLKPDPCVDRQRGLGPSCGECTETASPRIYEGTCPGHIKGKPCRERVTGRIWCVDCTKKLAMTLPKDGPLS